ncbi:diacylglycerol kinase family lipid kinase [Corynebacterium sp. 4HC-13]|uniref:diacylglycerol/lipid kinase family protein n=1 Tax=Corynebacterium anserum TaxID=2684406 RepID=UPI00163983F1|nr:diacylglycerol kinase family protein [Corynebacterium anserum]MBC2682084.1 diacylglycerol kinase family lipid kinase [Corynebacterium anserum]
MDVLIISNPNSTSITQKNLAHIIPTLRNVDGIRMRSRFTQYAGHAEELARQARSQGWDAVIAIGGDGTVSEVVNGLLDVPTDDPDAQAHDILTSRTPRLGIIPTGSANVLARSLGFSGKANVAVKQLAEALSTNSTRRVSMGTWADSSPGARKDHRWFAANVGMGIDATVIHTMEQRRAEGLSASPRRYMRIALQAWSQSKSSQPIITIRTSGARKNVNTEYVPLAFVSNTDPWTYFGPFPARIASGDGIDSGLSVFTVRHSRGWRPLGALLGLLVPPLRRGLAHESITVEAAHAVRLEARSPMEFQVDGEYKGEYSSIDLRFIPDAMEIFTPLG